MRYLDSSVKGYLDSSVKGKVTSACHRTSKPGQ